MDQNSILGLINDNVYGIWFLVGAALVFFMQCGFAMVEAGFTRAKNAGNIIMKNLMDFCLGTVVFILIGFGLLCGEDLVGIIGKPGFDIFSDYANFDWSSFVFNLVFCATAATIVSGAMAERTKFISYCIYSAVISAVIYPVETHWVWGGGWLSQLSTPFHDFAGSGVIHMVGGISALIGAAILGPRIGKFTKTKDGKVKVNAIPGHSLTIGALGVFILWFGWYGFNGAAATSVPQLGTIFLTTTIAPALATVSCMIFTWIKYGKPDVSMCLNASLAGLVAITAGCDVVDAFGSAIIGSVSGILVVVAVEFVDIKLDKWHFDEATHTIPIIIPRNYLNLYNFGFAQSRSLPKLSEGLMSLIQMDIMMRGNGRVEQYKGNIVGFSNRLNTILVPQSFMEWANKNFAPNAEAQPARLIIEVSNPADSSIAGYFQKKGYETEDGKLDAGKTTYFLRLIVGIVLGVGLFISILSFYILMLSIFLLLQKNTTKLESLLLIGYSPNRVALPYQILTVGLNIVVLLLSIGLVTWLRSYYIESIRLLFPQLETGSLWAAIGMGILLFLIVSIINILAVKRKVLSIWMHKS